MSYIYVITNKINGKQYVGQTSNTIQQRFKEHLYTAKRNEQTRQSPIYRAMRKYGIENFIIKELEKCSAEEADEKEIY